MLPPDFFSKNEQCPKSSNRGSQSRNHIYINKYTGEHYLLSRVLVFSELIYYTDSNHSDIFLEQIYSVFHFLLELHNNNAAVSTVAQLNLTGVILDDLGCKP